MLIRASVGVKRDLSVGFTITHGDVLVWFKYQKWNKLEHLKELCNLVFLWCLKTIIPSYYHTFLNGMIERWKWEGLLWSHWNNTVLQACRSSWDYATQLGRKSQTEWRQVDSPAPSPRHSAGVPIKLICPGCIHGFCALWYLVGFSQWVAQQGTGRKEQERVRDIYFLVPPTLTKRHEGPLKVACSARLSPLPGSATSPSPPPTSPGGWSRMAILQLLAWIPVLTPRGSLPFIMPSKKVAL